jgi:AraC family transcriptional regulator
MHFGNTIHLMDVFPDFKAPGFNVEAYNKRFRESNVIIRASARDVAYAPHWGPLSIKCAFNGNEHYEFSHCRYRVDDGSFLLLNEGQVYSSYIHSDTPVDSFTINFSADYIRKGYAGWHPGSCPGDEAVLTPLSFCERIYLHDREVSPYIFLLSMLSKNFYRCQDRIEECYMHLLHSLFTLQLRENGHAGKVQAVKTATQRELYQRLMRARDYIESCYADDISLEKLAAASCLNASYLLRQFKKYFGLTPRQYAIRKRMALAASLLSTSRKPVTEICYVTGYKDLTSFCKLFRQFYHASPQQYRLQHCGKKSIFT